MSNINGKWILLLTISLIVLLVIPVGIEYFIFRNNIYSVLENGEWGGFLGSYIGGILGGGGTLFAVYITTKETRSIQAENLRLIKQDREDREKKERQKLADEVAKNVARYITDISIYFYDCKRSRKLNENEEYLSEKLSELKCSTEKVRSLGGISQREEMDMLNLRLQDTRKCIDQCKPNRRIANECYFLLRIKLSDVSVGDGIIEELEKIHHNPVGWNVDKFNEEIDQLNNEVTKFILQYVNSKDI